MDIIDEKLSKEIWTLKGLAIMSIFFAHMPLITITSPRIVVVFYQSLGMIGVPTFFLLSGFLYKPGNWRKKIKRLFLPLLFWGTITYIIHCLRGNVVFGVRDYLLWIMGSNTFLYFVWMLFAIFLLFKIVDNCYLWIAIGLCSIICTQLGIIQYTKHWTPYLNPCNFIIYFSLGKLIREKEYQKYRSSKLFFVISFFLFLLTLLYVVSNEDLSWYFNLHSLLFRCSSSLLMISIVAICGLSKMEFLNKIGKVSYVIYLSHIQIAGTLNRFLPDYLYGYWEPLKIIIAFSISLAFVLVLDLITRRLTNSRIRLILGFS